MSQTINEAKSKQDAMARLVKNKRNMKHEAETLANRLLSDQQKAKKSSVKN